ncbi:DNA excision repair protein ERCC-1 [Varanus komodoensis]|uniref:DNA excision repair protein ERCC-1 isoform X1 n=1 Tax=Varanus komodoensis TaxID=61221 RepID=UPI001CF7C02A|nr:DNA excision repair protein ERCC-1 isoform X1 [Varanus komodoensis]KAF7242275.1 DNA excision repair protein ERCC-1 [Varanus komodoensis]
MEPQDTKKASEGKRKFTVKTSEEETIPVRLLFKPSSAAKASPVPEAPTESRAASYADYIVGQAGTASTSQVNQQAAAATATATSTEPPLLQEDQKSAAAPLGATEEKGCSLNPAPKPGARHSSIIVSPRQRGNPILKFVRNVPWEFGEIVPDYVLGQSTCALFLSLRYHNLNPNYIHERLRNLGRTYMLQVLLLQVDVKDPHQAIKELAKICILADCTLILAWSPEEAGRYLETYKAYEQKPADSLKEKVDQDYLSRATDCLTSVKSVNKTDTLSLLSNFGSLASISQASKEDLSLCPGIGPQKAKRLFDILHEPFLKVAK